MSGDVTVGRGSAFVLAGSVVVAGLAVASGAFLGGYALGDAQEPEPRPTPTDRIYTDDELRSALDTCGRDNAQIIDGAVVLVPVERQTGGTCILTWLDAPGPALTEYAYPSAAFGDTGTVAWANVTVEWEQIQGGRQTTITVE